MSHNINPMKSIIYQWIYKTPIEFDDIIIKSDGKYLTGLYFCKSKEILKNIKKDSKKDLPIFKETIKWLDIYFSGKNPKFTPLYQIKDLTPFRQEVFDILNTIPYGKTVTYNGISKQIAKSRKIEKMSPQAVGGAVGQNPICIIIPCHRVVGKDGNLTGYSGGMNNKIALLNHEKNNMNKFFIPKK